MSSEYKIPEEVNLPLELLNYDYWVIWRYECRNSRKPKKVPLSPRTLLANDALNQFNQLPFSQAIRLAQENNIGVGIALTGAPIFIDGEKLHLIGFDFDNCDEKRFDELKITWRSLNRPYAEFSPSGKGMRWLGASKELLKGGNAGNGRELYSRGRFLTITGDKIGGSITDQTEKLAQLHNEWFGKRSAPKAIAANDAFLDTPQNRTLLLEALMRISADCSYETYRNVVWGVISTGLQDAIEIARNWSLSAPHRFHDGTFLTIVSSFDPNRPTSISFRTVFFLARNAK